MPNNRNVGRRRFVQVALGTKAAADFCAGGQGAPAVRGAKSYRETLETPVVARYQVVVAGGGPSGVIAATAAARSGATTLLIERYSFLGGSGTASLMTCYNGFRNQRPPESPQTVKGIAAEYIAELVKLGGVAEVRDVVPAGGAGFELPKAYDVRNGEIPYDVGFDPEVAKIAALNLLTREGVKLRLHSWVAAPMLDGSRVTGVIVESKSGRQAIAAEVVIDCTGDGDVAAAAGASVMRPSTTGDRMRMTLMYRLGGVPSRIEGHFGGVRFQDRVVKWGPGADGDALDADDLTRAEVETRLRVWSQVQQLRKRPGMESIYLMETPASIGVRETRRIEGEYVVTEKDALDGARFDDVIAISSNPLPHYRGERVFLKHVGFDIPYRALTPRKIEGLLLSGRCISCEQGAFQSARSMAPAMAIGHASGCAAALSALGGTPPRKLEVKALQKLLEKQNAVLRT